MNKLIDDFTLFLSKKQRVSENTLMSYRRDVEAFLNGMGLEGPEACSAVTRDMVQDYVRGLEREGKADSTVLRSASSIRSFYGFLAERGLVEENPADSLILPSASRKAPVVLTPGEISRLMAQPKVGEAKGARDKAMLELLYATGMKVSELISIELRDIDLDEGVVVCHGGEHARVIPMGGAAGEAVRYYLENVREDMVENQKIKTLFVNCSGQPMTRQGFWKLIKSYIEGAGIKKHVTPQTLRHSFAVHLLQNGADADTVSQMMGYSDTVSTKFYSEMLRDRMKKVYNRSHPRA